MIFIQFSLNPPQVLSGVKFSSKIELNYASQLCLAAATRCVQPVAYKFTQVSTYNECSLIPLSLTSQSDPCFAMGNSVEKLNFASHQMLDCARLLPLPRQPRNRGNHVIAATTLL